MPHPPTRCRYFDDDGVPINNGCNRGGNCSFIHPSDPKWKTARSSARFSRGGNSGSWKDSSDFLATSTFANTFKLPETGSRWGSGAATTDTHTSSNRPWPSTSMEVDTHKPAGWNISSQDVGWGASSTGGWQSSSWGQESGSSKPSAALDGASGTHSRQASGSGWGATTKATTSGNTAHRPQASEPSPKADLPNPTPTFKSAWTMDTTETADRNPTPPIRKNPPLPGRSSSASMSQKPELRRLDTNVQNRLSSTPTPSQPSMSPSKKAICDPPPTAQTIPRQISPSKHSPEKQHPKHYRGPNGRVNLFKDTILQMQHAIIAQLLYQRVFRDNDQWKRTQISEIYGHATPEARRILDKNRQEFFQKVAEAKKRRDIALSELIQLPDLDTQRLPTNPNNTMEQIAKYTRELKEWFIDAKLPERLMSKKKEEEVKAKEVPTPLTAHELLQKGEWTWGELRNAVGVVEERLNGLQEELYNKTSPRVDHHSHQSDLETLIPLNLLSSSSRQDAAPPPQQIQELKNSLNITCQKIQEQGVQATKLFEKLASIKDKHASLVTEKIKVNEFCNKMEPKLVEMERHKVSLEAEIKSLTLQLQTPHLHQPSSPAPPMINYDQIVEPLIPGFLKGLQTDLQELFGIFDTRVQESQKELQSKISDVLTSVTIKTEAIRKASTNLT